MPNMRDVLALLSRSDLIEFVDAFGIEVADKRKKDALVEALAHSKKAKLPEMLGSLTVPQLRELCEQLGLGTGRSRAELIERLTGSQQQPLAATEPDEEPDEEPTPKKGRPRSNGNGNVDTKLDDLDVTEGKLTTAKLERYLWSAADILRGSIDSNDYKSYIFGLLFLKRLSDRFNEECEALVAEGIDPEDEDEH